MEKERGGERTQVTHQFSYRDKMIKEPVQRGSVRRRKKQEKWGDTSQARDRRLTKVTRKGAPKAGLREEGGRSLSPWDLGLEIDSGKGPMDTKAVTSMSKKVTLFSRACYKKKLYAVRIPQLRRGLHLAKARRSPKIGQGGKDKTGGHPLERSSLN